MSSRVIISVEDYEYLETYQRTNAYAVKDAFGNITGYSVWDIYANQIKQKKIARSEALAREIKIIQDKIDQMDKDYSKMKVEIKQSIDLTSKKFQTQMEKNTHMSLKKMSDMFSNFSDEITKEIKTSQNKMFSNYRREVSVMVSSLKTDLETMNQNALKDIASVKHDIALMKSKENQYASAYLVNAKEALKALQSAYDQHYANINIISNLKYELQKCEVNIKNGLYQAAMANAIDIQSKCYEEICNFDMQRQEYNALAEELSYHVNYLLKYSEERIKIKPEVLKTVNAMQKGKKLSKSMLKKNLTNFSPDHAIDINLNLLNDYKQKLEANSYTLQDLKDELKNVKSMYKNVDKAFNDAVAYYGNYLEREAFMNSIIDAFEDHGRICKGMRLGERGKEKDFTQPIFVLFEDESAHSEFMVEINYIGSPDTQLESEFHVHKIKGDPHNQIENDQTEKLVHQAITESNNDAIHGGVGCQNNTRNILSKDQRILEVRKLM